jgi:hypothetical protein
MRLRGWLFMDSREVKGANEPERYNRLESLLSLEKNS